MATHACLAPLACSLFLPLSLSRFPSPLHSLTPCLWYHGGEKHRARGIGSEREREKELGGRKRTAKERPKEGVGRPGVPTRQLLFAELFSLDRGGWTNEESFQTSVLPGGALLRHNKVRSCHVYRIVRQYTAEPAGFRFTRTFSSAYPGPHDPPFFPSFPTILSQSASSAPESSASVIPGAQDRAPP